MIRRLQVIGIVCRFLFWLALLPPENAWSDGLASLSGTWKLNKDLSDDPQKRSVEDGDSHTAGGGSGRWGGRRGGGIGRGGSGSQGSSEEGQRFSWEDYNAAMRVLKIRHQEPELSIEDASGRQHILYTDGRNVEEERSLGGTTAMRAQWKEGRIVVTTEPERGPKLTEIYAVAADGSQLTVTIRVEGRARGRGVEFRRVYDAVRPSTTPGPAVTPASDEPVRTG
jgi:hypothetical protein